MKGKKDSLQKWGSSPRNKVDEIELSKCVHLFIGHLLSYDTFFLSGLSLQAFLRPETPTTSSMHPAIFAELRMAMLVAHHNTFFNLSDHLTPYINEFKGSRATANFSCGRTKTVAIVNCVGNQFQLDLIADLKNLAFSLILDGSNDIGVLKMFSVVVRIFNINHQRIMTKFFHLNLMEGLDASTTTEIFSTVDKLFIKHGISWDFVTAPSVDNANANIREHNSLKSRALEKNRNIFIAGCTCHIFHNAACKFGSAFATVTGFDNEDHCVDFLYWFDKSSKRKSILKEYYEFRNCECEDFIKYVSTRWLCLERCVNRELKKVLWTEILFPVRRFTR